MLKNKKRKLPIVLVIALCLVCLGSPLLYYLGRPLPVAMHTEPFQGSNVLPASPFYSIPDGCPYCCCGFASSGNRFSGYSQEIRPKRFRSRRSTTSQFARSTGVQIAINGDGFSPWQANGPFDYFPHVGDRVAPAGYAMSKGWLTGKGPVRRSISRKMREASFTLGDITPYNAISGNNMIVVNGVAVDGLDNSYAAPRTAIGLDESGKNLILFVADGRQPFYSQGATLYEMAQLMIFYGADNAMNMDGGGSSTLVMRNSLGIVQVINSPIQTGIPGRERPVGNHLGIFAQP